ncbi:MAG TPA: dihydrofolate reductase family protein [Gaiellaceae bacterium]|nr:dihydrofolate reductase family protein [Gaiellaceae bacterium]
MSKLTFDITMSLDGFIAGPNATLEEPLGEGGEQLHDWLFGLKSWREQHGLTGGTTGTDAEILEESVARVGATVMGRRMFSGGAGPWEDDPKADGWWGDEPPFHGPVFVLTHHAREPVEKQGGTTYFFVTDGIEAALDEARAAAGDKDVAIAGGASIVQQYLRAGLVDEFQVHVAPRFLGGGVRLFDGLDGGRPAVKATRVVASPTVTHLRYEVEK